MVSHPQAEPHEQPASESGEGRQLPPGPQGLSIAYYGLLSRLDEQWALTALYKAYGSVVRISRFICVKGPEANRLLLTSSPDKVRVGPVFEPGPPGLRSLDGAPHFLHRKLVQQAFTQEQLTNYIPRILHIIHTHRLTWGEQINLYPTINQMGLDILLYVVLGIEPGSARHRQILGLYWRLVNRGGGDFRFPLTRFWSGMRVKERMWALLRELLTERRAAPGHDVLSTLLKARDEKTGYMLSDDEVVNYAYMLIEAGRDDSVAMLAFVLAVLAVRADLVERLCAEHDQYVGDGMPTLEQVSNLPFTLNLLREVERLYPPVPTIVRYAMTDLVLGQYRIPASSTLLGSIYHTHRLHELFPNPHVFDPDRFAPPREEHKNTYCLVGFSGGVHQCLGKAFAHMEATVMLVELFRHYRFRKLGRLELPDIKYVLGGSARFRKEIMLEVRRWSPD